MENIDVQKWGKLKTCDADIQLFYVEGESGEALFMKAYDNRALQGYLPEIEKSFRMRINNKAPYASRTDSWESSAYYLNPMTTPRLKEMEVNTLEELEKLLSS